MAKSTANQLRKNTKTFLEAIEKEKGESRSRDEHFSAMAPGGIPFVVRAV